MTGRRFQKVDFRYAVFFNLLVGVIVMRCDPARRAPDARVLSTGLVATGARTRG